MGYEVKLLVGKTRSFGSSEEASWFEIMSMVDLSKPGYDSHILNINKVKYAKNREVYWFFDGNTKEYEDSYGDRPKPIPIKAIATALKKDVSSSTYRRFNWALSLIQSMQDDPEKLEVLIYGY